MNTAFNPIVCVMMSTYNGEKWLGNQLDSVLKQKDVKIHLIIRDDGSTDNTISILNDYQNKYDNIDIYSEENLGAEGSFYKLAKLGIESTEFEYYAFCDQDDIWMPDKLITAVKRLSELDINEPNLYFSNLMMVQQDGKTKIGKLLNANAISVNSNNALASIGTYGCTCVFNRVALEKFCKIRKEHEYVFHDNWIYSICVFCGQVVYDDDPHIYYRQTGENASGKKKNGIYVWKQRIITAFNIGNDLHVYEAIADEMLFNFFDELNEDDQELLIEMCNYRNNFRFYLKLIFTRRMKTKSLSKNICIIGRTILKAL